MFSRSSRRLLDCASAPSALRIRLPAWGNGMSPKGGQLPSAWQWYGDAPDRLPADRTASHATDGVAGDESTAVVGHLHVPSRDRSHPQIGFVKVALCMRVSQEMKA